MTQMAVNRRPIFKGYFEADKIFFHFFQAQILFREILNIKDMTSKKKKKIFGGAAVDQKTIFFVIEILIFFKYLRM